MNTSANLQILPIDDKCKVVYKAAFMWSWNTTEI